MKHALSITTALFALLLNALAFAQDSSALLGPDNKWRAYEKTLSLKGNDLLLASAVVRDILSRSKIPLSQNTTDTVLSLVTEDIVRMSAADKVGSDSSKVLFFNLLADVFGLAEFENGTLKQINFASGEYISSVLKLSGNSDKIRSIQRMHEYGFLKQLFLERDLTGLFARQYSDKIEVQRLSQSIKSYIQLLASVKKLSCVEYARKLFFDKQSELLMAELSSKDVRDSVKLVLGIPENETRTTFIFGDTLTARAYVFLAIENKAGACDAQSSYTMYFYQ